MTTTTRNGRWPDVAVRFWSRVDPSGDCWLWQGAHLTAGYGKLRDGRGVETTAHRVSWELHNGPIPDGWLVLHRCDTPPCVNPSHLWIGTPADNMADMVAKGRGKYEAHYGDSNGTNTHPPKRDGRGRFAGA